MKEEAIRRHPTGSLTKFVQGAMFVPFRDAMYIQLGIGKDGENTIPCIKSHRSGVVQCRRTWARNIYTVQTKDMHWYGTQFRTIPTLRGQKDLPSMMYGLSLLCFLQLRSFGAQWITLLYPSDLINGKGISSLGSKNSVFHTIPFTAILDLHLMPSSLSTYWRSSVLYIPIITLILLLFTMMIQVLISGTRKKRWDVCSHHREVLLFLLLRMFWSQMSLLLIILMGRISSYVLGYPFLNLFLTTTMMMMMNLL